MSVNTPPSLRDLDDPKLEALVEVMFLAAFADGDFGEEEKKQFTTSVETLTDRRVSGNGLAVLLERLEKALGEGREKRLAVVKERLPEEGMRKAAFSLAVQVVAADGIVRTSERELLLELAEGLDLDRDVAANLVKEIAK